MSRISGIALSLVALSSAANAQTRARFPQARGVVVIENVTVIPMDRERKLDRQTVVVRDGRIAELGAAGRVRAPAGATRIDGTGKFLIPGLAEMHGHIPNQPAFAERTAALYVANGITTVRGMLGTPFHLELRDRIAKGDMIGPVLFLAGPPLGGQVSRPGTAASLVRQQHAAGYDLLKVHEGLSREVYDSIVATARSLGIPFGGHVSDAVGLHRALEAKQSTIDHLDNYYQALQEPSYPGVPQWSGMTLTQRMDALARATKAANVAVVPTMVLWEVLVAGGDSAALGARPENRYIPPQMLAQWKQAAANNQANKGPDSDWALQLRKDMLMALRRNGATILFGTDSPQLFSVPGYSMHHELDFMVKLGFTPYELIEAGTRKVAEFFGMPDEFGVIKPGARANLVLLDADPLADVKNLQSVFGVMLGGRWLPAAELRAKLDG